ncbi:iron chelate uptake ABC transporter family permease subunit [Corynebacterium bovis]|uniref:ABC transporter permease n=1 Tax=Corynebacterium bovis TaxID=36808 RepID=UPI003139CCD3
MRGAVLLTAAVLGTVGLAVLSLFVGVYDVTGGPRGGEMFLITRVPRTVALVLAGAATAVCGLVMQMLTQNRFVEPGTSGTTEWAGLGLITATVFLPTPSLWVRMAAAIAASVVGTLIFFAFLRTVALRSSLIVPVVGLMLGAVVGSVSTFVALTTNSLQNLGVWFAGSFTGVVRGRYEILWIVLLVTVAVFILADRLTVAGLGEDVATGLGLNHRRVVLLGVGMVSVVVGVVTVVVGNLPFIGLVVPNLVSLARGDNLRTNLPWVCVAGVALLVTCDILGRTLIAPFEVPVSLILGIVGATVFVVLLVRSRRG